jgi:hypothetical protein
MERVISGFWNSIIGDDDLGILLCTLCFARVFRCSIFIIRILTGRADAFLRMDSRLLGM